MKHIFMRKQLHIIFIALSLTIGFVGTVVAMNETETNNKKTRIFYCKIFVESV